MSKGSARSLLNKRLLLGASLLCAAVFLSRTPCSAEIGVTADEIRIGSCAPLSGPVRDMGIESIGGASAYLDYVNKELGGVHGRKIKLSAHDDKYDTEEAIACSRFFLTEQVFAVAFLIGTPTAAKYVPLVQSNKIPTVGIASGAEFILRPVKRYVFTLRSTHDEEVRELVNHLWKDAGVRQIGVILQNDALGATGLQGILQALKERGSAPVAVSSFARGSVESVSKEIDAAIENVRKASPEVVFLIANYVPAAETVKRSAASGWKPLFVTTGGRPKFIELAGKAAEGVIWPLYNPLPSQTNLPAAALFNKLMKKYSPDIEPSAKTFETFINAMLLVEGLKRAGKDLTREKFVDALESMRDFDVGLGPDYAIQFSPSNHRGFKGSSYAVVRGGKEVPMTDWKGLRKNLQ